jgi:glycosyltransferase involved in cell wall biosynthesis
VRVLHVVQRYPPAIGGAETWCAGLARWQAAQGYAVEVLTLRAIHDDELWGDRDPRPLPTAVGRTDHEDGVHVSRCVPARPVGPAFQRVLDLVGLPTFTRTNSPELYGRLLRRIPRVDIVHAHAIPGPHAFAAWLGSRLARRPFVLVPHFHAGQAQHEQRAVRALLRRLVARGVAPSRITRASNAIDVAALPRPAAALGEVRAALHVPGGSPLVAFVGRKHRTKDLDVLLAAIPLVQHRPTPILALAGPSTGWFEELKRRVPLDRVRDLPSLSEAAKMALLAAADVLVLPSRAEAFGIVFLEAWAAGTPVLGADIPTVREVIGDGGLTFRAGDPVDLAARIDELLAGMRSADLVARGRARVTALHTWPGVGRAVHAAYVRAAANRPARRPVFRRGYSCG